MFIIQMKYGEKWWHLDTHDNLRDALTAALLRPLAIKWRIVNRKYQVVAVSIRMDN